LLQRREENPPTPVCSLTILGNREAVMRVDEDKKNTGPG
jgi:hypothetical protein